MMDKKRLTKRNHNLFKKYLSAKRYAFKIIREEDTFFVISVLNNELKVYKKVDGIINENTLALIKQFAVLVFKGIAFHTPDFVHKACHDKVCIYRFLELPITHELYLAVYLLNPNGTEEPYVSVKATAKTDNLNNVMSLVSDVNNSKQKIKALATTFQATMNIRTPFFYHNFIAFEFLKATDTFKNRHFFVSDGVYHSRSSISIYAQEREFKLSKYNFEVERNRTQERNSKDQEEAARVTFKDVYCLDDIVSQFRELGDLITNHQKYEKSGARLPYGILLVGEPGTGKTLLLNAFINEYNLKRYDYVQKNDGESGYTYSISDLFEKARDNKPAVIVVDEIDKIEIGSSFFQEMGGVINNDGILVLATANSLSGLHPAILRPGRFDRKIFFQDLTNATKKEMLKRKLAIKNITYDIDLDTIIEIMPSSSPADIDTYVNEAHLRLTINDIPVLTDEVLMEAIELVSQGYTTSPTVNERTRAQVRIHEAGHAIIAMNEYGAKSIAKIDTTPSAIANGYVQLVQTEGSFPTKNDLLSRIKIGLGGIVAEKLFSDDISVGARQDLNNVRHICEQMIVSYGLLEIASITSIMFNNFGTVGTEEAKNKVISESERIIKAAEKEVRDILTHNQDEFQALVNLLKEKPVLLKKDVVAFSQGFTNTTYMH